MKLPLAFVRNGNKSKAAFDYDSFARQTAFERSNQLGTFVRRRARDRRKIKRLFRIGTRNTQLLSYGSKLRADGYATAIGPKYRNPDSCGIKKRTDEPRQADERIGTVLFRIF
jgi:hypothetical protein